MPETYNPQERTFIRKPEPKVCASCGQPIAPDVTPMTNHMNLYMAETGNVMAMNSNENMLEVGGVKVYKVTSKEGNKHFSTHMPVKQTTTPETKK